MEGRPKRQSTIDKDYRERKRIRKDKEVCDSYIVSTYIGILNWSFKKASPAETEEYVDKERVQAECQQLYNYIKECRDPEE